MRNVLILLGLALIILISCNGTATPDPMSIQRAVQATLTAIPTATSYTIEVTHVVTVEPSPTAASTATPTSTPRPTVVPPVIPASWKTYRTVGGISFAYPPTMELVTETSRFVEFSPFGGRTLRVYSDSAEVIQPLESLSQAGERLQQLKRVIVEAIPSGVSWPQDDRIRQGLLDVSYSPAYIWYAANSSTGLDIGFGTYATNGERTILITLGPAFDESLQTNPNLLEDMVAMLTEIVRSVQL